MYNDIDQARYELVVHIDQFEREVKAVYTSLVLPNWGKELHGFPQTLYGYMMAWFSRLDLISAYWQGNENNQTVRMIDFMDRYIFPCREANSVAVQMWRHKLMHTSEPRNLYDNAGKPYRWLLHWWEHLPIEQHYVLYETPDCKILNIGLIYWIADLKRATDTYVSELELSSSLQQNYEAVETQLASYKYRPHLKP
jgi:hypothetical protein